MKAELFNQQDLRLWSRKPCSQRITVNPNTLYANSRPCRKSATYIIDEEPMCSAHAGRAALDYVLKLSAPAKAKRAVKK